MLNNRHQGAGAIYVSITGLELLTVWQLPFFWWYAVRSMVQARRAPGNLFAESRKLGKVHHTVTAWRDAAAMHDFLRSGAHAKAMKAYGRMRARGKVCGFDADARPDWSDVPELWERLGRPV